MAIALESAKRLVVSRVACPAWPDCEDDEGACLACVEAAALLGLLERAERIEAAARAFRDVMGRNMHPGSPGDEEYFALDDALAGVESPGGPDHAR